MITVKLIGGLGNQMFQYALYRAFELKGREVCLDDYTYFNRQSPPPHLIYHLDIFDLKYRKMDPLIMPNYLIKPGSLSFGMVRKLRIPLSLYREKGASKFDPDVFLPQNANKYFEGYWQSEKYFENYKNEIKKDFHYNGVWSQKNIDYRHSMENSESVSLHIRRGDYLKSSVYTGICTESYYKNAIEYIKSHVLNPTFFIFSNDLEWCKSFFGKDDNVAYVEGNDIEHSYMDMVLMTSCKHHVIANSSFSWWGAWLGPEGGITIAPSKWYQNMETPDIWCNGWIKMD